MTHRSPTSTYKAGLIEVNGTKLYYEDTGGSGEPIVFSHALLLDNNLFAPQVEALKNSFRCISYEHRGQGRSADDAAHAITIETVTEDAVALIEKLELGSVHFCGLSMGGFVGIRIAANYPHLVRSLILIGTCAEPDPEKNKKEYKVLNFIARWLGPASVARTVAPIIYGKSTMNDPARSADRIALIDHLSRNRRSIWRAVNGVISRVSMLEHLPKIKVPTVVVVGEEDTCHEPSRSEHLAQSIEGAVFRRIPRAGHAVTVEQPAAINEILIDFLEKQSRRDRLS